MHISLMSWDFFHEVMTVSTPNIFYFKKSALLNSVHTCQMASGDLPNPGMEPASSALAGGFFTISATWEALVK